MAFRHQHQKAGFTLIELLVVIAIIGTLASVILASLSTARDKAKVAGAESTMHQVFLNMSECAVDGGVPYCYGSKNSHTSSSACGGGSAATPVVGTAICGGGSSGTSASNWPDLSNYGYSYGTYYYGNSSGAFDFEVYNSSGDHICCTQDGCSHITDGTNGGTCKSNAGL